MTCAIFCWYLYHPASKPETCAYWYINRRIEKAENGRRGLAWRHKKVSHRKTQESIMRGGHLQSLKKSRMHNPSHHHFLSHENTAPDYSSVVCFQFKCLPSWPGDSFPLSPGSNSFIRNLANKVFSTCQPSDIRHFQPWHSSSRLGIHVFRPKRSFAILCQLVLEVSAFDLKDVVSKC